MNRRPAGWPSPVMWATLSAGVVSLLLTVGMVWLDYARNWSFLEKFYLPMVKQTLLSQFNPLNHSPNGTYALLEGVDARGKHHMALPGEVEEQIGGDGKLRYVLTEQGQQRGLIKLEWHVDTYEHKYLRGFLGHTIYQDNGVWGYIARPVYYGAAFFVLFLFVAVPKDRKRTKPLREGRRLQGPEPVSVEEFNRRNQSDGIGFWVEPRNLLEKILRRFGRRRVSVHSPRKQEAHHIMIMGDTGVGKSSRIRETLLDIEQRGEGAIVHDSQLEYTPLFYKPERGDIILNPLDQRMPYWSPCDEVAHEAEAATIAASLFPDSDKTGNEFFVKGPRRIFARLLTLKLSPEELVRVMGEEKELDRIVKGTDLESLLYQGAGPQRGGVMGETAQGMAVSDLDARDARGDPAADEFMAGHAGAASDESLRGGAPGVVRAGRTRYAQKTAAAAQFNHADAQIRYARGAGFPGPQPDRGAIRTDCGVAAFPTSHQNLFADWRTERGAVGFGQYRGRGEGVVEGQLHGGARAARAPVEDVEPG